MRTAALLALFLIALTGCNRDQGGSATNGSRAEKPSTEGVSACFTSYKAAILGQDGEKAADLLTQATIDQYQTWVDLALTAEREDLEALSFINRMQVILLRHRIPVEVLRSLDGRSTIVYAVDRDWIGKDSVIRTELGEISVANHRATAEVKIGGRKTPNRFQFREKKGLWKFDLISVLQDSDAAMSEAARQTGLEENAFLFRIMESATGKKIDESIWDPPH